MKTSEKLKRKLIDYYQLEIPESEVPRRYYHGYYQRSSGAWSWVIGGTTSCLQSWGSQWSMKEVLNAEYVVPFDELGGDISLLIVNHGEYQIYLRGIYHEYIEKAKEGLPSMESIDVDNCTACCYTLSMRLISITFSKSEKGWIFKELY